MRQDVRDALLLGLGAAIGSAVADLTARVRSAGDVFTLMGELRQAAHECTEARMAWERLEGLADLRYRAAAFPQADPSPPAPEARPGICPFCRHVVELHADGDGCLALVQLDGGGSMTCACEQPPASITPRPGQWGHQIEDVRRDGAERAATIARREAAQAEADAAAAEGSDDGR